MKYYWNPKYNCVSKEPLDENAKEIAASYINALFAQAELEGRAVVNGTGDVPVLKEVK